MPSHPSDREFHCPSDSNIVLATKGHSTLPSRSVDIEDVARIGRALDSEMLHRGRALDSMRRWQPPLSLQRAYVSLLPSALPPTKLPTMSSAPEFIEQIVKAGVTPTLKPLGFRKSGRTFRRTVESAVQVINVQSCKWNTADEASFRINLGVFFPEIFYALYGKEGGKVSAAGPHEPDCTIRTTLGELLPRPEGLLVETPSAQRGRPGLS